MCQARRDGGRRCPHHRHDSAAVIAIVTERTGLLRPQTDNLFSELRREGRHTPDPAPEAWEAYLGDLEKEAGFSEENSASIKSKIEKAREHSGTPDGATLYAQKRLIARAKERSDNLNARFRTVAEATGKTVAQIRQEFNEEYLNVDTSRGSDVPEEYTQMSRRRAVQSGIPYDRATVVALARVEKQASESHPRVTREPVPNSSFLAEYGYNEEGGRLEITFQRTPDVVYAYHNVPSSIWERMRSASAGSVYSREIRGRSEYQYASREESEADAYNVRCTSCGQFRASSHVCARRAVSDELDAQGVSAEHIEEVLEVNHPLPVEEKSTEEESSEPSEAEEPMFTVVRTLDDLIGTSSEPDPDPEPEVPVAVETEPETEPEATPKPEVVDETPAPSFIEVAPFEENAPDANVPGDLLGYHSLHEVTAENQRIPKVRDDIEGEIIERENVKRVVTISPTERGHSHYKTYMDSDDVHKMETASEHVTFVLAAVEDPENQYANKYKIIDSFDNRQYKLKVISNGGWFRNGTSKYQYLRRGHNEVVETFDSEKSNELRVAENDRLTKMVDSGEAVVIAQNTTFSNKYKFDANLAEQPKIRFANAAGFKRAMKDGKVAVTSITVEGPIDSSNKAVDDQGFSYLDTGGGSVTGNVAFRKNSKGVVEVVSSPRTLRCNCYQYRREYNCAHVSSVQRHIANVAQQSIPVPSRHRLLTAALANRGNVTVVENDKNHGTYISFGEETFSASTGRRRRSSRHISDYAAVPQGVFADENNPTPDEAYKAVAIYSTLNRMYGYQTAGASADIRRALERADVSIPVTASFSNTGYASDGGEVNGTMLIHQDNVTGALSVRHDTLKCTCADYQANYDCEHVRASRAQPSVFANVENSRPSVPNLYTALQARHRQLFDTETAVYRDVLRAQRTNTEVDVNAIRASVQERVERERIQMEEFEAQQRERRAAQQRERMERFRVANAETIEASKAYREEMMNRWSSKDPSYAENPKAFYEEYKAALKRRRDGEEVVPYQTENVTDGVCGDGPGARKFGVEIEFDIDRSKNRREALIAIGKELHEAGLTAEAHQTYYHSAAASGWAKWSFEQDCTVDAELVSPIMSDTPEDWRQLKVALDIIKKHGGKGTARTGSHVHISTASYEHSSAKYGELLRKVTENEDSLFRLASSPERGKHRGTRWCKPNTSDTQNDIPESIQEGHNLLGGAASGHGVALNFESASKDEYKKSNVEFRIWDGTLDAGVIQQQIKVSAALTDYAERSVIENKGSKKTAAERKGIGNGKAKETVTLINSGKRSHDEETFAESHAEAANLLDKIFRKNEDKAGVAALFAITKWQERNL